MRAYHCSIRRIARPKSDPVPVLEDAAPDGALDALAAPEKEHLAIVRDRQWPNGTVLRTAFLDAASPELRRMILSHLNAWGARGANITFRESKDSPQIRISRSSDAAWGGFWSYLGPECLDVPANEPTMNLEGFTTRTPESEFTRVVRHEAGHTLGFVHEHLRPEIVGRIDPAKAIAYFKRAEGWSKAVVQANVLTALPQSALVATRLPEERSIMAYWLPRQIMRDGRAVIGGTDITTLDARFSASIYPRGR